jgi:hypothetical protein
MLLFCCNTVVVVVVEKIHKNIALLDGLERIQQTPKAAASLQLKPRVRRKVCIYYIIRQNFLNTKNLIFACLVKRQSGRGANDRANIALS